MAAATAGADADGPEDRVAPWGRLVPFRANHAHLNMYDAEYSIGRSKRCSLRLHDPQISGTHCTIRKDTSGVYIIDSSTNGTYVNSHPLVQSTPRLLHNGDQISLVQRVPSADAADATPAQTQCAFSFYHFKSRPPMGPPASSRAKPKIDSMFELRRELGTGSFGKVFLGRRRSNGEEVAIKMIRKRALELSAHSMTEVVEEANMMVRMKHPYLARLESCWNDKEHIYLVMDLYRGGELFERVVDKARGPYTEAEAQTITLRLLLAVQHLHERNVAHRDLKPENIMIADPSDETDVRIVDFGGAKQMSESGMRSYVGSLQYMAPEVMRRKGSVMRQGRYDMSCDMWSLGIIAYVIISGFTPFNAAAVKDVTKQMAWTFSPPHRWAPVSSECRDFIRRLLDIDPAERLAVDEALMHPWIEAKYKEWSLAHPEHASDHAKLRFEIGAESSSGAGAGSAGEAVAAAEPLHRTPHPAAAASASSDSASSSSSSAAAAAVAARAADDDDSGGNRAGTSGRVNKRGRPTTVDSTADVKATDSDASKPAGAKRSTPK